MSRMSRPVPIAPDDFAQDAPELLVDQVLGSNRPTAEAPEADAASTPTSVDPTNTLVQDVPPLAV